MTYLIAYIIGYIMGYLLEGRIIDLILKLLKEC